MAILLNLDLNLCTVLYQFFFQKLFVGDLYFANLQMLDNRGGQLYKCNLYNPTLDITVGGSYAQIRVNPVSK